MELNRSQPAGTPLGPPLYWYGIWSLLSGLQGLVALVFYLRIESMERNAVFLGLSAPRIVLGAGALLLALSLLAAGTGVFVKRSSAASNWYQVIDRLARRGPFPVLGLLLGALLTGTTVVVFLSSSLVPSDHLIKVVFLRVFPILIWSIVAGAQLGAVLIFLEFQDQEKRRRQARQDLRSNITVALLIGFTGVTWLQSLGVEYLPSMLPSLEPGSWPGLRPLWVLPLTGGFTFIVVMLLRDQSHYRRKVIAVTLLALGLIGGMAVIQRRDNALQWRIERMRGHTVYAKVTVEDSASLESLTRYEEEYSEEGFLSTKPPGVLVVHMLVDRLVHFGRSDMEGAARLNSLLQAEARLFPLLAVLVVPVSVWGLRPVVPDRDLLFASVITVAAPNFLLFTWSLDQALYPALFLFGLGLAIRAAKWDANWLYLLVGAYAYAIGFLSFSLLPFAPAGFLLTVVLLRFDLDLGAPAIAKRLLFMLTGFLGMALMLFLGLNYDPLVRFTSAMEAHREYMRLGGGVINRPTYLAQLATDYSIWLGLPLTAFAALGVSGASYRTARSQASNEDLLLCLWGGLLLVLALGGQSRIEVGRLWLFMNPLAALAAAVYLRKSSNNAHWMVALLGASQLITTVLILTYQFPY